MSEVKQLSAKNHRSLLLVIVLFVYQSHLLYAQRQYRQPVEVQKCAEYKRLIYEKVTTFGFLMHDAEEMRFVSDTCNASYVPFIVGGSAAGAKEFPHAARLGNQKSGKPADWFCGGTLISDRFVMTAAHCTYSVLGDVNIVRLGELDFSSTSDDAQPEDFNVRRIIIHPSYSFDFTYNDIALLELDRPVTLNRYKHPACLPITSGDQYSEFLAIGWGSTVFGGSNSKQLLKVKLNRFNDNRCREIAADTGSIKFAYGLNASLQMCAGSDTFKDTCNGDSGGPLLVHDSNYPCMHVVVGITSAGLGGCGTPNVPGVYTRVYYYMNWIKQIVFPGQ